MLINKWIWKMDWCKAKGLAPAQPSSWDLAETAFQKEVCGIPESKKIDSEVVSYLEGSSNVYPLGSNNFLDNPMEPLNIKLPTVLIDEVSEICAEKKITIQEYIQNILEEHLNTHN